MKDMGYFDDTTCDVSDFEALIDRRLAPEQVPLAADIVTSIPVYDMASLAPTLSEAVGRQALLAEWGWVFGQGAGVVVLRGAWADTAPLDAATEIYHRIIADERAHAGGGADHFAASGANDRIWNSLQKLCLADPAVFAAYFGNPALDAVCEAWLGPNYQMTAQVNLVRPGGGAQEAHRDYHLGFQTASVAGRYPAHVHALSAALTLQGAVAHCDMPVESGPTKLLPFSQLFGPGYLAYRLPAFRAVFEARHVQVPLQKGDAVFFNPALFHAAGANTSQDIHRMANLLQVSSAFGRAMERLDRSAMCLALYPVLLHSTGHIGAAQADCAISACAEGYSFPTNLDRDPPVGGLAPETQAALMRRALAEGLSTAAFEEALAAQADRRRA